jgi:8-oxo-dGTP diphosphatase
METPDGADLVSLESPRSLFIENRFTGHVCGSIDLQSRINETIHLFLQSEIKPTFNTREIVLALVQFFLEENPMRHLIVEISTASKEIENDLKYLGFRDHFLNTFILNDATALLESSAAQVRGVEVAVGVLKNKQGQIMMGLCVPPKPLAGLWEFPGGKVESGEIPLEAVIRELREELAIHIHKEDALFLGELAYIYPHIRAQLFFYLIQNWEGIPFSQEHHALLWVFPSQAEDYSIPPSTSFLLKLLARTYG